MTLLTIILFGIVVLITHFLEGITGFGCTVLALPFCAILVGVKVAVPVLTVISLLLAIYIIAIDYRNIVWKQYFRIIAFVGCGLPIGMVLFSYLPENTLKKFLGIFMILISIRGMYICFKGTKVDKPINKYILECILFLGGIIHGAFSTGGPFVIIYASQELKEKSNFRATLSTVWLTLNSVVIIKNIFAGSFTPDINKLIICVVPFLAVGMILGNWAHHRIKDTVFTKVVYTVLFVSGFFMFI